MGQFYDEEKIKAMEAAAKANASGAPEPTATPAAAPSNKPSGGGHFYDESKIGAMEKAAGNGQAKAANWGFYAIVALLVFAFAGMLWWKTTHNPDTMIVNINKASAAEIAYLPGIGPAKAKVIIDHRPYQSIEDLKKVPGIGEKTFEKMKARVKVE